jgi:hypothetical protein
VRPPFVEARAALVERMRVPPAHDELPPYLESFLAHLRLLVGVPFENLVPDPRLLPPESLRFFYLDRSWSDRLVDGALAVGKVGTREQAHHQDADARLRARLDGTERVVRVLQRGLAAFQSAVESAPLEPAGVVTGLLLRSVAVRNYPHMDVRAFRAPVADDAEPSALAAQALRVLRLERVAPSVLLALFEGIPRLVWLEEPLHSVPLGAAPGSGGYRLYGRPSVAVPFRAGGRRVVHMTALRSAILGADAALARDSGGGAVAEALLGRAHRQRFEGRGARPRPDGFRPTVAVARRVDDTELQTRVRDLLR